MEIIIDVIFDGADGGRRFRGDGGMGDELFQDQRQDLRHFRLCLQDVSVGGASVEIDDVKDQILKQGAVDGREYVGERVFF